MANENSVALVPLPVVSSALVTSTPHKNVISSNIANKSTVFAAVASRRQSDVVKEVDKINKQREEQRAEQKAEKIVLRNPRNENQWQFLSMIRDYRARV